VEHHRPRRRGHWSWGGGCAPNNLASAAVPWRAVVGAATLMRMLMLMLMLMTASSGVLARVTRFGRMRWRSLALSLWSLPLALALLWLLLFLPFRCPSPTACTA